MDIEEENSMVHSTTVMYDFSDGVGFTISCVCVCIWCIYVYTYIPYIYSGSLAYPKNQMKKNLLHIT